jgi:fumarate reductase subunit C
MKPYERSLPATWWLRRSPPWWLRRWPYFFFMLRELSSVFVAAYLVVFLVMIHRLSQGQDAYESFLATLKSPLAILFHVVALGFALLHTITWFNLTPKAIAIRRGEERVPAILVIAPNYVAWLVISAVIAWFVLKG